MAWVRCGGTPSNTDKLVIYKNGEQFRSLESPGSYTYPGDSVIGATFLSDHISIVSGNNNVSIVGIVVPIDVTDYSAIHIVSRTNLGAVGLTLYVNNSKSTANYLTRTNTGTNNNYHETVLDISSLSGNKYIFVATDQYNMDGDVKEIWLTKV